MNETELMVWLVLAAIVLVGLILAQGLSYLAWTFMRENPPMAARIGWFTAIVAALATVTWYWYPCHLLMDPAPNTFLVGEGVGLLVVLIIFILTLRRRPA